MNSHYQNVAKDPNINFKNMRESTKSWLPKQPN